MRPSLAISAQAATKTRMPSAIANGRMNESGAVARRTRSLSRAGCACASGGTTTVAVNLSAEGCATTRLGTRVRSTGPMRRLTAFTRRSSRDLHLEAAGVLHGVLAVPRDAIHQLRRAHHLFRHLHAGGGRSLLVELDLV